MQAFNNPNSNALFFKAKYKILPQTILPPYDQTTTSSQPKPPSNLDYTNSMAFRFLLPRASANLQAFQIRKHISSSNTTSPLLRSATQAFKSRKPFSVTHPCLPLMHIMPECTALTPKPSLATRRSTTNILPLLLSYPCFDLQSFTNGYKNAPSPSSSPDSSISLHVSSTPQNTTKLSLLTILGTTLLTRWHTHLSLAPQVSRSWYRARYAEESIEFTEAVSYLDRLSEEADLFFVLSRSRYDGFPIGEVPGPSPTFKEWESGRPLTRNMAVYAYMFGKYSGRWLFHRTVARLCGDSRWRGVNEVINPARDHKLRTVAKRHGMDEVKFERVAKRLLMIWPLLP